MTEGLRPDGRQGAEGSCEAQDQRIPAEQDGAWLKGKTQGLSSQPGAILFHAAPCLLMDPDICAGCLRVQPSGGSATGAAGPPSRNSPVREIGDIRGKNLPQSGMPAAQIIPVSRVILAGKAQALRGEGQGENVARESCPCDLLSSRKEWEERMKEGWVP